MTALRRLLALALGCRSSRRAAKRGVETNTRPRGGVQERGGEERRDERRGEMRAYLGSAEICRPCCGFGCPRSKPLKDSLPQIEEIANRIADRPQMQSETAHCKSSLRWVQRRGSMSRLQRCHKGHISLGSVDFYLHIGLLFYEFVLWSIDLTCLFLA